MKFTRRRTDNQPGAVRTSAWIDEAACCPEPADSSERKICDGRADNQPGAARTIDSKGAEGTVPRNFARPANEKITRRLTDNQPGAVRTSAWIDESACCPEPADSSERSPNPDIRANAAGAAKLRTASNVRVGGVNNIAAVGCVWVRMGKIRGCRDRRPRPFSARFRARGRGWSCSRLRSADRVPRAPLPIRQRSRRLR